MRRIFCMSFDLFQEQLTSRANFVYNFESIINISSLCGLHLGFLNDMNVYFYNVEFDIFVYFATSKLISSRCTEEELYISFYWACAG